MSRDPDMRGWCRQHAQGPPAHGGAAYPGAAMPAYGHASYGAPPPPPGPYAQQGAYGHQGYYDAFGNWVPYTAADYAQWGYGGAAAGGGAYGGAATPAAGQQDAQAATGRGKGFVAKMGDRAQVKSSFTLEQRKARIGKGFVEGEGDEYGAEILVGGGGLVRRSPMLRSGCCCMPCLRIVHWLPLSTCCELAPVYLLHYQHASIHVPVRRHGCCVLPAVEGISGRNCLRVLR